MLANTIRIFTLALVAEWIGMRLAMALYHDFSGYLVFLISVALLMGTGSLLETDWRAKWRRFRQRAFSRT
jgi:exosortase/archaeosortase family protein